MNQDAVATHIKVVFDGYDMWEGDWEGVDLDTSAHNRRRLVMERLAALYDGAQWTYDVNTLYTGDEIVVTMSDGTTLTDDAVDDLRLVYREVYDDQGAWLVMEPDAS